MWTELHVKRQGSNELAQRIPLSAKRTRVGSSLRNDIILLDRSVPARAGEFQKAGWNYKWLPDGSNEAASHMKRLEIGPYEIQIRRGNFFPTLLMMSVLAFVGYELRHDLLNTSGKSVVASDNAQAVELPARGPFMTKTEFSFQFHVSKGESYLFHYSIGNVKNVDDVSIALNGKEIAFAPACEGHWAIEERLSFSKNRLRVGENQLTFHHRSVPEKVWGLRDIYLTRLSDEEESQDDPAMMIIAAEKLFRLRASRPGQLVRARQLLDRAIGVYKAERGTVPKSAIALQWEISRSAESLVSDGLSEAKSALSLGDKKKALAIYDRLLDELVDPTDPRKQEVVRARKEVLP